MAENDRRSVMQQAVEACVGGDVAALPEMFAGDVSGWSPNMLVTSLGELAEVVGERDEALSNAKIQVDGVDVVGNKGFMEYRVSAVFSGPFHVDDETTIDPNGRELVIGAVLVAEFAGGKISAFRNYFDDAALIEQMLAA